MDTPTATRLQTILRRESRSFLQFVAEAYPWTTPKERAALETLLKLIAYEREGVVMLGRFLVHRHVELPYLGTYPENFTTMMFVSLEFLLPRLVDEQRQGIDALEADLALVTDPAARAAVEQLLDRKRRHLPILEDLAATHAQAAVKT
jgi:hypothetical protein